MQKTTATFPEIDLYQFKSLLRDLEMVKMNISIRVKLRGESWMRKFSKVLVFSRHSIILSHVPTRTIKNITDPTNVVEFEINQPYKLFVPHVRYQISALSESLKIAADG